LKQAIEGKYLLCRGTGMKITSDFSLETMQTRWKGEIFKEFKRAETKHQSRSLFSVKLSFKSER
jgi:hypothetical protein